MNYLKPIAACQTKANNKKKTGTIGKTSTIGAKAVYASGNRAKSKFSIIKTYKYIKINNIKCSKFNIINFTIKKIKKVIYMFIFFLI